MHRCLFVTSTFHLCVLVQIKFLSLLRGIDPKENLIESAAPPIVEAQKTRLAPSVRVAAGRIHLRTNTGGRVERLFSTFSIKCRGMNLFSCRRSCRPRRLGDRVMHLPQTLECATPSHAWPGVTCIQYGENCLLILDFI